MDPSLLPAALRAFYFDFDWENPRVWALDLPVESMPTSELSWHLDLPIWSRTPGVLCFDLRPRDVLARPEAHPRHYERLQTVDLRHPIDMMPCGDRLVILDGVHRLARLVLEKKESARIRRVPRDAIGQIRVVRPARSARAP